MATFAEQIEALTSNTPDATEASTWLKDGAKDVIRRLRAIDKGILRRFAATVNVTSSGLSLESYTDVLDVRRGTYDCKEIPANMRHRVNDSDSYFRATAKHPKTYVLDNKLYVLPAPSASQAYASCVSTPSVASTASSITTFPNEYEPPVVYYAAMQHLVSLMLDLDLPTDISMPAAPVISLTIDKTLTAAVEATGVTLPTLSLPSAPTLATADFDSIPIPIAPSNPSFTTPSITMAPAPVYSGPTNDLSISTAMATVTTQIETNEDIELAVAKIQQVRSAVQDFANKVNVSVNDFNQQNTRYQGELQKEIEEAKLVNSKESNEYAAKLEKYKADVAVYQQRMTAEVQKFSLNEVQNDVNIWMTRTNAAISEYQAKAGAIVQKYSQEIASKSNLTKAEVEIFGAEMQRKAALNQATLGKYQADTASTLQEFTATLQKRQQQYTWYSEQHIRLAKQYESSFVQIQSKGR